MRLFQLSESIHGSPAEHFRLIVSCDVLVLPTLLPKCDACHVPSFQQSETTEPDNFGLGLPRDDVCVLQPSSDDDLNKYKHLLSESKQWTNYFT